MLTSTFFAWRSVTHLVAAAASPPTSKPHPLLEAGSQAKQPTRRQHSQPCTHLPGGPAFIPNPQTPQNHNRQRSRDTSSGETAALESLTRCPGLLHGTPAAAASHARVAATTVAAHARVAKGMHRGLRSHISTLVATSPPLPNPGAKPVRVRKHANSLLNPSRNQPKRSRCDPESSPIPAARTAHTCADAVRRCSSTSHDLSLCVPATHAGTVTRVPATQPAEPRTAPVLTMRLRPRACGRVAACGRDAH